MPECRNAEMQKCRMAEMQKCRNAEMQKCRSAEMQRCRDAEMQRCRMQKQPNRARLLAAATPIGLIAVSVAWDLPVVVGISIWGCRLEIIAPTPCHWEVGGPPRRWTIPVSVAPMHASLLFPSVA